MQAFQGSLFVANRFNTNRAGGLEWSASVAVFTGGKAWKVWKEAKTRELQESGYTVVDDGLIRLEATKDGQTVFFKLQAVTACGFTTPGG